MTFAAQELRLISALVVILGIGLFLALPFVLSIGSVVFLPLVTALILTIILSPLADKLAGFGLPNVLASLLSLLAFFAIVLLALALILQPAVSMFDSLPAIFENLGELRAAHSAAKGIDLKTALSDMPVPPHPGAAKYFKEKGAKL